MRKNLFVFLGLAAVTAAASTAAYAAADGYSDAGTGVTGSRHDINAFAAKASGLGVTVGVTVDSQERVCAFCHSPHHAYTSDMMKDGYTADYLPLWAHELTKKAYTEYGSATLNAVINDDPLVGPSRLCMSCHDGVIAVDTHYKDLGTPGTAQLTGDSFAGMREPAKSGAVGLNGNLAGDHPIGFDYDAARTADTNASPTLATGIRDADLNFYLDEKGANRSIKIRDTLWSVDGTKKYMTCATCHEVHNKDNIKQLKAAGGEMVVDSVEVNYFLYGSQSGSKICLSCHNK